MCTFNKKQFLKLKFLFTQKTAQDDTVLGEWCLQCSIPDGIHMYPLDGAADKTDFVVPTEATRAEFLIQRHMHE